MPLLVALSGWRGRAGMCAGVTPARGFVLGLVTGSLHYAGTVYWTGGTVRTYGGLSWPVAILVAVLLVLYLSLFVAAAAAAIAMFTRRLGSFGLWLAPAAWVTAEYARAHLFGGFPWIPLGNTMVALLPVAQVASVAGIFGLSFLVALLNAATAVAIVETRRRRAVAILAWTIALAGPAAWGARRMAENGLTTEGTSIRVALVQGNVRQHEKWNPARAGDILARYLSMTREVAAARVDLIIWPESATPFFFDEDPIGAAQVREVVRDAGASLLFGTDEVVRAGVPRYYNSAFLLGRDGATAAVYRKIHLVPFGEYVPFRAALFFVSPLVEAVSDFSAGEEVTLLPVDGHRASTAICYEVVYPHLIRRGVLAGSELLTTITNDAWYGTTSAPYQHFEQAAIRAIEQGRYLARAANTGISGIVDPYGRVVARTGLFETRAIAGEVRALRSLTLYARIGDLAAQASGLLVLAALAACWRRRDSMARYR